MIAVFSGRLSDLKAWSVANPAANCSTLKGTMMLNWMAKDGWVQQLSCCFPGVSSAPSVLRIVVAVSTPFGIKLGSTMVDADASSTKAVASPKAVVDFDRLLLPV